MTTNFFVPRRTFGSNFLHPAFHTAFRPGWKFDSLDWLFGDLQAATRPSRSGSTAFAPKVNVAQTDDGLRFSVELPGLEQDDFEVLVDSDVLIIKGEKKTQSSDEDQFRRVERSSGSFERRFRLGWEIEADNLKASYKNGVLEVIVPKPADEPETVRTIPVTAS